MTSSLSLLFSTKILNSYNFRNFSIWNNLKSLINSLIKSPFQCLSSSHFLNLLSFYGIFYWSIITLQCCIHFCCTTRWTSSKYTYVPSFLSLPPVWPLQATPLEPHRAPSWAPCSISQLPTRCLFYTWWHVHVKLLFQSVPPFLPPLCPQVCSLHLCLYSCPANGFIGIIFF